MNNQYNTLESQIDILSPESIVLEWQQLEMEPAEMEPLEWDGAMDGPIASMEGPLLPWRVPCFHWREMEPDRQQTALHALENLPSSTHLPSEHFLQERVYRPSIDRLSCPSSSIWFWTYQAAITYQAKSSLKIESSLIIKDWYTGGFIVPIEGSSIGPSFVVTWMSSGWSWTFFSLPIIATDHLQIGIITCHQFRPLVIFWRFKLLCTAFVRKDFNVHDDLYQKLGIGAVVSIPAIELLWIWNTSNDDWGPMDNIKVKLLPWSGMNPLKENSWR